MTERELPTTRTDRKIDEANRSGKTSTQKMTDLIRRR